MIASSFLRKARPFTCLLLLAITPRLIAAESCDVCVYGGNAAGVTAAIAASRNGAKVILVNPVDHVGGMVSGGLGVTDAGRVATIGGVAGEFFEKLGAHYGQKGPMFRHEPHVAEQTMEAMLKDAGVTVIKNVPLAENHPVVMDGTRIREVTLVDGRKVAATVFIDTSYEGDLMAQAGVKYIVGREARTTYDEDLAGVRNLIRHGDADIARDHQGLLPDIHEGGTGQPGEGDARIMSYNFRLCLTRDKDNQAPVGKPEVYDPRRYTLLSRVVLSQPKATLRSIFSIGEVPGGKTDFNNIGPVSSNLLNASWAYPEASPAERKRIWQDHRNYLQGLLYFLQNDPSVPAHIQSEAREWAFAKDEFPDNGHWPHQLYVREARRMIGEKVMTQHDLQKEPHQPDSVGMGSYMMDSHYIQRTVTPEGLFSEGTLGGDHRVVPYEVSYRSLLPKKAECTNLLVPVCLSSSHVAYASLRMEPVYMILGHAAGTAAALAVKGNGVVQEVDYAALREKLVQEKQVLAYEIAGKIDQSSLEGIVQDEGDAVLKGSWLKSTSGEPFVGVGYIHDNNTDKGGRIATYTLPIPSPGNYEVRIYYAVGSNRTTHAKVTITSVNGPHQLSVNQKEDLPGGQLYRSLGVFPFDRQAVVQISNEGTEGVVVADAVQLVPADGAPSAPSQPVTPVQEQADAGLFKDPAFAAMEVIPLDGLNGIVVDDAQAEAIGPWTRSPNARPRVGSSYSVDEKESKGACQLRFAPVLPAAGKYAVWLYYPAQRNRSQSVPVLVKSGDQEHTLTVDMRRTPDNGLPATLLGEFEFSPDNENYVEISTVGTEDGVVVADAVQWLPASSSPAVATKAELPVIEALADQILTLQLSDGGLRSSAETDTVRIVPYFSNIAAMALLATGDPRYQEAVHRWIDWYVARQEEDGTIYDFIGTVQDYKKSDHRDSTDSYAATFLQLLWRYAEARGVDAFTPAMRTAAVKAFAAIKLSLDTDGLTWAKPEYKAKYLMDNLEVCQGLREGAQLFRKLGEPQAAAEAETVLKNCRAAIATYWQPELGYFAWAKGSSGAFQIKFERWYPDGIIHLFALAAIETPPPGLWEKLKAQFGREPKLTPDWWLRASKAAGTPEEKEDFRQQAEVFARTLCQPKGQINRMGTTLLGLAEKERSTVDLGPLK